MASSFGSEASAKMEKNAVVVSAPGFLGKKITKAFEKAGWGLVPTSFPAAPGMRSLDVTDRKAVEKLVLGNAPSVVINCSALTSVDWCEENREKCFAVNALGPQNLAAACAKSGAKLVHFSTAFVFDGKEKRAYAESHELKPLNVYAESKAEAEKNIMAELEDFIIIRTTDLYGFNDKGDKPCFPLWVLGRLREGKEFGIVDDQLSQPTLIDDVASAALKLVELNQNGIFHIFGRDYLSKFEFAQRAAKAFGFDPGMVKPISTAGSPMKAPRPRFLKMDTSKAASLGIMPRGIDHGLAVMKRQMGQ